jgi:hypothetical protein
MENPKQDMSGHVHLGTWQCPPHPSNGQKRIYFEAKIEGAVGVALIQVAMVERRPQTDEWRQYDMHRSTIHPSS